jgi:hypothetical protein
VFLRSADNEFVLMPGGRLQIDGYFFKRDTDRMPTPSILLRRARLEVAGWVGSWFFYNIGGDFAAAPPAAGQSWLATTDDFVGIAPWKNLAMLQVGQFDAPFTLENRTSDKYFDFMERSITVRAFGIPSNKETGAMINGLLPDKVAYYSLGVFNGDGQNFRNVDAKFDLMGRAWIAPFALAGVKSLEDVEIGGSMWLGGRGNNGTLLAAQSTQGNLPFLPTPTWRNTPMMGAAQPVEVHQRDKLRAFAAELHVPIEHKYGARVEYVTKKQDLIAADATNAASLVTLSPGRLNGWSLYGEVWWWVVGDDTILPAPGLELPSRLKKFETKAPRHGVMLAAKVEHLDETIEFDSPVAGDTISGSHKVTNFTLGANYWYSKRFRASFNYVYNAFGGGAQTVTALRATLGDNKNDHEFLLRLGIAL